MPPADKLRTTVSTKGQVILPKAIRDRRRWAAGAQLTVEDTPEGVLLRPVPAFAPTRSQDVFGSLKTHGPARTVEDMNAGVIAEAKRRHERDRY